MRKRAAVRFHDGVEPARQTGIVETARITIRSSRMEEYIFRGRQSQHGMRRTTRVHSMCAVDGLENESRGRTTADTQGLIGRVPVTAVIRRLIVVRSNSGESSEPGITCRHCGAG